LGDIISKTGGGNAALIVRELHKGYPSPTGPLHVLRGVDLEVAPGEAVAVIGASGVGKSTLLHVAGALDVPDEGCVEVGGEDPFALEDGARALLRNRMIGFVFQFHHLMPEFTAAENVAMPLWVGGVERREALDTAVGMLRDLDLGDRVWARPDTLSGGERQRVAIARALVSRPALLLADEPTGNLDGSTARMVYGRMMEMARARNAALLVATHDMELAVKADRVLRLRDGTLTSE